MRADGLIEHVSFPSRHVAAQAADEFYAALPARTAALREQLRKMNDRKCSALYPFNSTAHLTGRELLYAFIRETELRAASVKEPH
jgi:hypothetical protein